MTALTFTFSVLVEPLEIQVFVNVYGAQDSIPRNRFRQARNRFLGSLKGLKYMGSGYINWWSIFFESILGLLEKFKIPSE